MHNMHVLMGMHTYKCTKPQRMYFILIVDFGKTHFLIRSITSNFPVLIKALLLQFINLSVLSVSFGLNF